jgi:hypothetical protein
MAQIEGNNQLTCLSLFAFDRNPTVTLVSSSPVAARKIC